MDKACYTESADVETKLDGMGLTADIVRQAVMVGQLRRSSCTVNDPPSSPGTEAWRWTVRTLRELLIPLGWERSDAANFSLIVNHEKGIAIAVNTGDEGTGNPLSMPRTKHPKGRLTAAAVLKNAQQLTLFDFSGGRTPGKQTSSSELLTWVLLVARDRDQAHYELFLPTSIKDGKPMGWKERIIFPYVDFAPNVDTVAEQQVEEDNIVVEVSRRNDA